MKICPFCKNRFESPNWNCPKCGKTPVLIKGFCAFAPQLAGNETDFFPKAHEVLDKLQHKSFWFRSRNLLIQKLVAKHCANAQSVLEIGCGTGYVLSALGEVLPNAKLFGSEIDTEGLDLAARRLEGRAELFQMDAQSVPFENEFDLIAACDVLEHIEDDMRVLSEIYKALKPGGFALLTVPQHPILWSATDENACHKRRYRVRELTDKAEKSGFEIVVDTSFVSTLFPVMFIQRLLSRGKNSRFAVTKTLELPRFLDKWLEFCLTFEIMLINAGLSLPFGGSRVVLAQKGKMI